MTRKKVVLERIEKERERNNRLEDRSESLRKKTEELSTLCGVEVGIAIYKEGYDHAMVWPSEARMSRSLERFKELPTLERERKLETLESYLNDIVEEEKRKLGRVEKQNNEIEMPRILTEVALGRDLNGFNIWQLKGLSNFAGDKIKRIQEMFQKLGLQEQGSMSIPPPVFPPPPPNYDFLLDPPFPSSFDLQRSPPPHTQFGSVNVEIQAPPPIQVPYEFPPLDYSNQAQGMSGSTGSNPIPSFLQPLVADNWFLDTMFDYQNIFGPGEQTDERLPPGFMASTSGTKESDEEQPDDPNN